MKPRQYVCWLVGLFVCLAGCGSGGGGGGPLEANTGSTITGRAVNNVGSPVSGAQVSLLTSSNQPQQTVQTTTTNSAGNFAFWNINAGTYIVSLSVMEPSGPAQSVMVSVSVLPGATVNVPVSVATTVSTSNLTGAIFGNVTASGTGVVGATVTLQSQSNASLPSLTATTDGTGSFSFTSIAGGEWLVSVHGAHFNTPPPVTTNVEAGASSQVDFTVALIGSAG